MVTLQFIKPYKNCLFFFAKPISNVEYLKVPWETDNRVSYSSMKVFHVAPIYLLASSPTFTPLHISWHLAQEQPAIPPNPFSSTSL